MREAEIVHVQDPQAETDFGADGVEVGIEGFLGDGEIGDPHRDHAALAPH